VQHRVGEQKWSPAMKQLAYLFAVIVVFASSACSSNRSFVPIYDTFFDVTACEPASTACGFMSFQFGTLVFENAICTVQCVDDFDGPPSFNGEPGGCYPQAFEDGFPGCVERCFNDGDCPSGFTCSGASELGFLAPGDSICVPGPS
jgi:hypothetical protein